VQVQKGHVLVGLSTSIRDRKSVVLLLLILGQGGVEGVFAVDDELRVEKKAGLRTWLALMSGIIVGIVEDLVKK
jgi:hypothetical protein